VAILIYGGAEAGARLGFSRISKLHHRIMTEQQAALAIRPAPSGSPPTLLVVGNSLLLEGLDFPRFTKEVSPRFQASRFVVEGTAYNDWYFTLRTLFRHGMRPDVVALGFNAPQLATDEIRGDFPSRFLLDVQDIWPIARASHADLTTTSSLYAAHFSTFYGGRSELRSVLMGRIFPRLTIMWQRSIFNVAVIPPDAVLVPVLAPRLKALSDLCGEYGARFVFLIPPTMQHGDVAIVEAGKQGGVSVLRPVRNFSLGLGFYQDGLHLNQSGAAVFTEAAAQAFTQFR